MKTNQTSASNVSTGTSGADLTLNQLLAMQQPAYIPQPSTQPGAFRRVLGAAGGVVGTAASVLFPGLSALGGFGALGGLGGLTTSGLSGLMDQASAYGPTSEQYLMLAKELNVQSEAFEATTNIMKSKHSSTMNVIQNMGS